MKEQERYKYGAPIVYVDSHGVKHDALVTTWHGVDYYRAQAPTMEPGVNLAYVSQDTSRTDSYGRQIERQTSVCHKSVQPAHGNYWLWPEEVSNVPEHARAPHNDA